MSYRPSPALVAANAALVHFLERHPGQRLTSARREGPADTAHAGDVGRQAAALREGDGGDGAAREERGKGKGE